MLRPAASFHCSCAEAKCRGPDKGVCMHTVSLSFASGPLESSWFDAIFWDRLKTMCRRRVYLSSTRIPLGKNGLKYQSRRSSEECVGLLCVSIKCMRALEIVNRSLDPWLTLVLTIDHLLWTILANTVGTEIRSVVRLNSSALCCYSWFMVHAYWVSRPNIFQEVLADKIDEGRGYWLCTLSVSMLPTDLSCIVGGFSRPRILGRHSCRCSRGGYWLCALSILTQSVKWQSHAEWAACWAVSANFKGLRSGAWNCACPVGIQSFKHSWIFGRLNFYQMSNLQ